MSCVASLKHTTVRSRRKQKEHPMTNFYYIVTASLKQPGKSSTTLKRRQKIQFYVSIFASFQSSRIPLTLICTSHFNSLLQIRHGKVVLFFRRLSFACVCERYVREIWHRGRGNLTTVKHVERNLKFRVCIISSDFLSRWKLQVRHSPELGSGTILRRLEGRIRYPTA